MPPHPKDHSINPAMRQSVSDANEVPDSQLDVEHGISVISQNMPHVNTQDPLIVSGASVYCDTVETDVEFTPVLSTCRRFLYGLASPPSPMCGNILGFLMSVYLLEVAKLPPSFVLTLSFAGRFWDAISDPIVGHLVSKTRTPFGQCRIWVLISSPFCALAFFLFFNTPAWESINGRFVYYFVVYFAFCTFLTTYHIPYTSMTMLISERSIDRDAATTFRMIFEMIGTLFGVVIFTFVTQSTDRCDGISAADSSNSTQHEVTSTEENRYRLGAAIIAFIVLMCGCFGFFGTKEVTRPTKKAFEAGGQLGIIGSFRRCLSHRPYRLLMFTFMLSSLAIQTVQNTLALYTIHTLKMKSHLKFAITIVMSVAILSTPMVFYMIRRIGKKRVFYVGLFLILPVCISATLCPAVEAFVPLYYVTMVVAGCFVSVNMLLPWIMLPDVIDDYTVAVGRRDEATFYSLYVFFNKFALGISTALLQLALHITGYLQPPACKQPEQVGLALRVMIGPLPMMLVLMAFLVLHRYPITPEYRQKLDDQLKSKLALGTPACMEPVDAFASSDRMVMQSGDLQVATTC